MTKEMEPPPKRDLSMYNCQRVKFVRKQKMEKEN